MIASCGRCGGQVEYEAKHLGESVVCPHCSAGMMLVPRAEATVRATTREVATEARDAGRSDPRRGMARGVVWRTVGDVVLGTLVMVMVVGAAVILWCWLAGVIAVIWLGVCVGMYQGNRIVEAVEKSEGRGGTEGTEGTKKP